ncbi:hypothetical protein JCM10295v2_000106 [Rhodotorula toruloides]
MADERDHNEGATTKLPIIIERSHDHQIQVADRLRPDIRVARVLDDLRWKRNFLVMLIQLKGKRPPVSDDLLAYADDFEDKAEMKGSPSYARLFNRKSVPYTFKEETTTSGEKKIIATGSQILMQKVGSLYES